MPPRSYGIIKAHKSEKHFPMRVIVSTTGTLPYGTSKYLEEIIQPTLVKSQHTLRDSN